MFEKLKDIIAEVLGTDKENINLESNLGDDLGAGSLDALDVSTNNRRRVIYIYT